MRAKTIISYVLGAMLALSTPVFSFAEEPSFSANVLKNQQVLADGNTSDIQLSENGSQLTNNDSLHENDPVDTDLTDNTLPSANLPINANPEPEPDPDRDPEPEPEPVKPGWNLTEAGWEYRRADGSRVESSWIKPDGSWYYLDESGIALKGRGMVDGTPYYFDRNCRMAVGWARDPSTGAWYYAEKSGSLASGWRRVSGSWYWLDPETNAMAVGRVELPDGAYYLKASGAMAVGWAKDPSTGAWYYAEKSGSLASGWRRVSGSWYWLDPETNAMAMNEWKRIEGNSYRFNSNGAMLSNMFYKDQSGWHYLSGSGAAKQGRYSCSSGIYVFDQNDSENHYPALTGFQTLDGKLYHFNNDAQMTTSTWVELQDGSFGFASKTGEIGIDRLKDGILYLDGTTRASGFVTIDDNVVYADPNSGKLLIGWQTIDGKTYWFDSQNMTMRHGWLKDGGNWYWFDKATGVMKTGWLKDGKDWYWLASDGKMQTDWQHISGDWYYFTPSTGAMYTGVLYWNGKYYFLSDSGKMLDLRVSDYAMFQRAQQYSSSTSWLIMVDTNNCHIGVYQGRYGSWKPVKEWICSTGKSSTPTVLGQFRVTGKGYSFGRGYTCYYYTQFYGDYLLHSIPYNQGTFNVQDGRLGVHISHGCVRLSIENAKWIYDNIPYGTKVVTY